MDILYKFFQEIIFPGFKLTNLISNSNNIAITFYLSPEQTPKCPHCNSGNVVVHEYRTKTVKAGAICGIELTLVIIYRTLSCNCCDKYSTENIEFISKNGYKVTTRLEKEILKRVTFGYRDFSYFRIRVMSIFREKQYA